MRTGHRRLIHPFVNGNRHTPRLIADVMVKRFPGGNGCATGIGALNRPEDPGTESLIAFAKS